MFLLLENPSTNSVLNIRNLNTWHVHLKDNVTPNMYTINFHYLRHIHDTIKALGPLRGYSTRSAERAIGKII